MCTEILHVTDGPAYPSLRCRSATGQRLVILLAWRLAVVLDNSDSRNPCRYKHRSFISFTDVNFTITRLTEEMQTLFSIRSIARLENRLFSCAIIIIVLPCLVDDRIGIDVQSIIPELLTSTSI